MDKKRRSALRTLMEIVHLSPSCNHTVVNEIPVLLDALDHKDRQIESLKELCESVFREGGYSVDWKDSLTKKHMEKILCGDTTEVRAK